MFALVWGTYLFSVRVPSPTPRGLILDLVLVLSAQGLVVVLALCFRSRARCEAEIARHLAARDEFIRMHESLGDRPPTSFFR